MSNFTVRAIDVIVTSVEVGSCVFCDGRNALLRYAASGAGHDWQSNGAGYGSRFAAAIERGFVAVGEGSKRAWIFFPRRVSCTKNHAAMSESV